MSQARTVDELRKDFLYTLRELARYWADLPDKTPRERCNGLAFSMLVMFDGCQGGFPAAVDLVLRVHPDDKQFAIDEGENWIEDGTVLNADCHLHDMWPKYEVE